MGAGYHHDLKEKMMTAYAIFDVEIYDPERYQACMSRVKPVLESFGGRYLSRGGAHNVYEGDWEPRRIVLFEFPSIEALERFYYSDLPGPENDQG